MTRDLLAAICLPACAVIGFVCLEIVSRCLEMLSFGQLNIKHLFRQGCWRISDIWKTMKKHKLAMQLLDELVIQCSIYKYHPNQQNLGNTNAENAVTSAENALDQVNTPIMQLQMQIMQLQMQMQRMQLQMHNTPSSANNQHQQNDSEAANRNTKKDTPILIAARMGVLEVVKKTLDEFPVACLDFDSEGKNVVLLAAENKRTKVYQLLLDKPYNNMFILLDDKGNSALHLAATFNKNPRQKFPEDATQMRWEFLWYKFVKHSMPPFFFTLRNKEDKTPEEIFTDTHKELVKSGSEWFVKTSESCSVVAALIATVAFASITTVPGGYESDGTPIFAGMPIFNVFAISSLLALCFSVIALLCFLAIRTSGFKENDFAGALRWELFVGMGSLFASLASILVSFCSRHYLMIDDTLKSKAFWIYISTGSAVIIWAVLLLPIYFRNLLTNFGIPKK